MKNKKMNVSVFAFFMFLLFGMVFSLAGMTSTIHADEVEPVVQYENTTSEQTGDTESAIVDQQETSPVPNTNDTLESQSYPVTEQDESSEEVRGPQQMKKSPASRQEPLTEIYLNGVTGNDSNDGTAIDKAVKTFEKAKELASLNTTVHTIYVTGTVDISGDISLDGINAIIKRHDSFNNYLMQVKSGATATLSNITIDGNSEEAIKTRNSLIYARGTLNIEDGTVLRNNVLTDLGYFRAMGGAVLIDYGTVNMTGGVIENNTANLGGGIFVNYGTLNMSGGSIRNNKAIDGTADGQQGMAAGGGVIVYDGSTFNLSGSALIQNNTSDNLGGGISIGAGVGSNGMDILNMTGGTVTDNTAGSSGGGIMVQAGYVGKNGVANISGGNITNNRMTGEGTGNKAFGGGGIYVNGYSNAYPDFTNGVLNLTNAIIKENTASMEGGGYASCPNSETHIYVKNGVALYENNAGSANEIYIVGSNAYGLHSGDPIYSISPFMLGGAPYIWKYEDGTEVPLNELKGQLLAIYNQELALHTDATENSAVLSLAKVIISGNTSATRGAGIGSNGTVNMGEYEETEVKVTKQWDDFADKDNKRPTTIIVELYRSDPGSEEKVYIGYETMVSDGDGNWLLTFTNLPKKDADGNEYVYSVKERTIDGYMSRVSGNMNDGFTIDNILSAQVTVRKVWNGTIGKAVTVQLLANGQKTDQLLILKAENNWMGSFIELAKYDENGAEIQYSVNEDSVSGVDPENYMVVITGDMNDGFTIINEEKQTPPEEEETPPEKETPPEEEETPPVKEPKQKEEKPSTPVKKEENQTVIQKADPVQTGFGANDFIWFVLMLITGFGIFALVKNSYI